MTQTFLSLTHCCEYIYIYSFIQPSLMYSPDSRPCFLRGPRALRLPSASIYSSVLHMTADSFSFREKPASVGQPEDAEESGSGVRSDQSDAGVEDCWYVVQKSFDIMQINHHPSVESPQMEENALSPEALQDNEANMFLVTTPAFQDPLLAKYGMYKNLPFIE